MEDAEVIRTAFEKWAKSTTAKHLDLDKSADGQYESPVTAAKWEAWQASWKAALYENMYEDVYEQCQELIDPHIIQLPQGSCCNEKSLCASVVGSLGYLIDFWLKHRGKNEQSR